jgi:hypothetical protein
MRHDHAFRNPYLIFLEVLVLAIFMLHDIEIKYGK